MPALSASPRRRPKKTSCWWRPSGNISKRRLPDEPDLRTAGRLAGRPAAGRSRLAAPSGGGFRQTDCCRRKALEQRRKPLAEGSLSGTWTGPRGVSVHAGYPHGASCRRGSPPPGAVAPADCRSRLHLLLPGRNNPRARSPRSVPGRGPLRRRRTDASGPHRRPGHLGTDGAGNPDGGPRNPGREPQRRRHRTAFLAARAGRTGHDGL